MDAEINSSRDFYPFEEPHWTECCPYVPLLPPLERGDTVTVYEWNTSTELEASIMGSPGGSPLRILIKWPLFYHLFTKTRCILKDFG